MRPAAAATLLAMLVLGVAACGGGPPADTPEAAVRTALDRLEDKDLEGLADLACEGQEDVIREQLGLPAGLGGELLPGIDTEALLNAVELDTSELDVGAASIEGDVAQVPVSGDVGVTFDADQLRPLLKQVLESQGQSMTDEQIDALVGGMEAFGQDVPMDEQIRLVREAGTWKICQQAP